MPDTKTYATNKRAARPAQGLRYGLRALGERDFAIFWGGALFGNMGGWMQGLAVPYVLFMLTDSAAWIGLAGVAQFLPGMILGPLGGVIAERHELRRVLLVSQSVRAFIALALFFVMASDWNSPVLLLTLACAAGAAQGIQMPSWQAFVYRLVRREDLTSAITLNSAQFTLARSFGPAIAGGILLWWGAAVAILIAFFSIMIVIVALALIRFRQPERQQSSHERKPGVIREFGTALRYVGMQPGLIVAMSQLCAVGLLGMPVFQHVIVFSEAVFKSGGYGLAVLNLALGIGTVIGVPLISLFERRMSRAKLAAWAFPAYAIAIAVFSAVQTLAWGFVALVFVGAFFLCAHSIAQNTIQIIVASHMRGRVLALQVMIGAGTTAIGSYLQGALVDHIGPRLTVFLTGATMMLFICVLLLQRDRRWLRRMNDSFGG
jgi:MFS family permease